MTSRTSLASRRQFAAVLAVTAMCAAAITVGAPAAAVATESAESSDSAVTIAWAGGNDPALQQYQPDHAALSDGNGNDNGSGHWNDFKNLEITVSQTTGLRDQAVTVTASGMAPTVKPVNGRASNFLQMFQCWGPDPLAADFGETCQYGAFTSAAQGANSMAVLGESISPSTLQRSDTRWSAWTLGELPFRAVWGERSQPYTEPTGGVRNGISAFFTESSTNEKAFVPIRADGTAVTSFEVQSASSAPQLGCGDRSTAAGERCWLVIVPRGTHSGALRDVAFSANYCGDWGGNSYAFGAVTPASEGNPLDSRQCAHFANRIVVPLTFDEPAARCDPAAAERRVSGSELVAEAMSSWQPTLCTSASPVAFGLTTNSGSLIRSQLLSGTVDFAVTVEPVTADTIGDTEPEALAGTEIGYAPLANTALSIAYVANKNAGKDQYHDLRLTPRLIAKVLTQSYRGDVPHRDTGSEGIGGALPQSNPGSIHLDPEWRAIGNPSVGSSRLGNGGLFVVSGGADDATQLLWDYVLADADAVAFLRGEPDPWGMTVNRYYLPPDDPAALGGGYDLLSGPIDTFPRADQTLAPAEKLPEFNMLQLDSVAYMPYSSSLTANATRILRADPQLHNQWDPHKLNSAGESGAFVSAGVQPLAVGQFLLGPTALAASERYDLDTMALALPTATRTTKDDAGSARTFVAPTEQSLQRALAAQDDPDGTGVATLDYARLAPDAYPLTTTLVGAVDLAAIEPDAAADYAHLLDYAAGDGQQSGSSLGELPAGYTPLTEAQRAQTAALADALRSVTADPSAAPAPAAAPPAAAARTTAPAPVGNVPVSAPQTQVSTVEASEVEATAAVTAAPAGAVGGALAAGVAGLIAAPFLLRRRGGTT